MEQQQTKLPLEWLSSRRTPELHRLEQLCRRWKRRWHPNGRSHVLRLCPLRPGRPSSSS